MISTTYRDLFSKRSCVLGFLLLLLFTLTVIPQAGGQLQHSDIGAQEAFFLAIAKAEAQTNLHIAGMAPFEIHAKIVSDWAWHAVRDGIFEEQWVDRTHWKRSLKFSDFEERSFKNDGGAPWVERSTTYLPIRARQLHQILMLSLPSMENASSFLVTRSTEKLDDGQELSCFSTTRNTKSDNPNHQSKLCFEKNTGLLRSIDQPSALHISFEKYIQFQGKFEYTVVHVTADQFPVLDVELDYSPLHTGKIEGLEPLSGMKRESTSTFRPNPEEWKAANLLKDATASLPLKFLNKNSKSFVKLHLFLGVDGHVLDAALEAAPTEAMANAALRAAGKLVFSPYLVNNTPTQTNFLFDISFSQSYHHNSAPQIMLDSPTLPLSEQTLHSLFAICHTNSHSLQIQEEGLKQLRQNSPSWYPDSIWASEIKAVREIDLTELAMPIYQKYLIDSTAKKLLRVLSTSNGQQLLVRSWHVDAPTPFEENIEMGDFPVDLKKRIEEERLIQEEIYSSLTSKDQQDLFTWANSEDGKRLIAKTPEMMKELDEALLLRQIELLGETTKNHRVELLKALQNSKSHPQRP